MSQDTPLEDVGPPDQHDSSQHEDPMPVEVEYFTSLRRVNPKKIVLLAVGVIVPIILLTILQPELWWLWTLTSIIINILARMAPYVRASFSDRTEKKQQLQLQRQFEAEEAMHHYVTPSTVALSSPGFDRKELYDSTLIDEPEHWINGLIYFFNPFAGRKTGPRDRWANAVYIVLRHSTKLVAMCWVMGWLVVLIGLLDLVVVRWTTQLPDLARVLRVSTALLMVFMTAWTVGWGVYVARFRTRNRIVVTEEHYAEIIRQLPFRPEETRIGSMKYLQSVVQTRTWLGALLGYGHFTIQSWQDPEPVEERRYVANPERFEVLLTRFARENATRRNQDRIKTPQEEFVDPEGNT